jgi:hypothetical protein
MPFRRWWATNYIKTRGVNRNILSTTLIYDLSLYYFVRNLAQHHGRVAHTFDRAEPSTPCCWRRRRLGHRGRGVLPVGVVLWLFVLSHLFELFVSCRKMVQKNLKDKVKDVTLCPTLACTTLVVLTVSNASTRLALPVPLGIRSCAVVDAIVPSGRNRNRKTDHCQWRQLRKRRAASLVCGHH